MFSEQIISPEITLTKSSKSRGSTDLWYWVSLHPQAGRSCCCKFLQGSLALPNLPLPLKAEEDIFRQCLVPQQQKELGTVWRMWQMGESDVGQEASWSWRESLRVKEEEDKKMQTGRKMCAKLAVSKIRGNWAFSEEESKRGKRWGNTGMWTLSHPIGGDTFQFWNGGSTLDAVEISF